MNDSRAAPALRPELRAALPFLVTAAVAVISAGLLAAFLAHLPSRQLLWTVAYLVLVVGVGQAALGTGRAWFSGRVPVPRTALLECVLFNLANAGVIAGTLLGQRTALWAGTALFAVVLLRFLWTSRGARGARLLAAYRLGTAFLLASAATGLFLSLLRAAG